MASDVIRSDVPFIHPLPLTVPIEATQSLTLDLICDLKREEDQLRIPSPCCAIQSPFYPARHRVLKSWTRRQVFTRLPVPVSTHSNSILSCDHHADIHHHLQPRLLLLPACRSRPRNTSWTSHPRHDGQQRFEEESHEETRLLLHDRWQQEDLCRALPAAAPHPVSRFPSRPQ